MIFNIEFVIISIVISFIEMLVTLCSKKTRSEKLLRIFTIIIAVIFYDSALYVAIKLISNS